MATPEYQPPECVRFKDTKVEGDRLYDPRKWDVYSFAMVLYFMWTQRHPFEGHEDPFTLIYEVARDGLRPVLPGDMPPDLAALLVCMWDADPSQRPHVADVWKALPQATLGDVGLETPPVRLTEAPLVEGPSASGDITTAL
jgi:hypothetical protein